MDDRRLSPNLTGSSPPSPVLDLPPSAFIATANASCDSRLMDPSDMAPVTKRFTISLAGSISSSVKPAARPFSSASGRHRKMPRSVDLAFTASTSSQYWRNVSLEFAFVAICNAVMPAGVLRWSSPPFR